MNNLKQSEVPDGNSLPIAAPTKPCSYIDADVCASHPCCAWLVYPCGFVFDVIEINVSGVEICTPRQVGATSFHLINQSG